MDSMVAIMAPVGGGRKSYQVDHDWELTRVSGSMVAIRGPIHRGRGSEWDDHGPR